MTQPLLQVEREDRQSVDSEDVVATSTAGALDVLEVQELEVQEPALPESVMPGRQLLNDPGSVNALVFLRAAAETALEERNRPKPLVAIPTADLITHTSFKVGSKFVIRLVPAQDNKSRDKSVQDQVLKDQQMYFDRASLQSTSEIHEERFQIFEAFDGETLFLFGEKPKIWNFQFIVVNGNKPIVPTALNAPGAEQAREEFLRRWNMDFCDELARRYQKYYRGSAALKLRARLYMSYEDVLIEATLIGMTVSRNNTLASAANLGLTFVVHPPIQYLGESLTFGSDATLAQLLASEDQKRLMSERLSPSSILPSKKSADQLIAEYQLNQAAAQESQAAATDIQSEAASIAAALAEAETAQAEADARVNELFAQLDEVTDPQEEAELLAEIERAKAERDSVAAFAQDMRMLQGAREEDLVEAAAANDVAIGTQQVSEAQLEQSTSGNLVESPQTLVTELELIETDAAGTRNSTVYLVPDDEAAAAIIGGATPDSVGATFVTQNDVTDNPDYANVADGSFTRRRVSHT